MAELRDGDRSISSLPINFKARYHGAKGGILEGKDSTGWLRLNAALNFETKRFSVSMKTEPTASLPASALPLLRWLVNLKYPNRLAFNWPNGDNFVPPILVDTSLTGPDALTIFEALAIIQEKTGVYFEVANEFSKSEVADILATRRLLGGDMVRARWASLAVGLSLRDPERLDSLFRADGAAMVIEREEWVDLLGHEIPLGRIRTSIASARPLNPGAIREAVTRGLSEISLELVPGGDSELIRQRLDV
jgi:hypothetical protein